MNEGLVGIAMIASAFIIWTALAVVLGFTANFGGWALGMAVMAAYVGGSLWLTR